MRLIAVLLIAWMAAEMAVKSGSFLHGLLAVVAGSAGCLWVWNTGGQKG